jgi:hypothetical protein
MSAGYIDTTHAVPIPYAGPDAALEFRALKSPDTIGIECPPFAQNVLGLDT